MKLARLRDAPEIFASIQGEGRNLGQFSVFVRASQCNLHCVWCDTDYTWNWAGTPFRHVRDGQPGYRKFEKSAQMIDLSPADIMPLVVALRARNVVLTGGEPLLQQEDFTILVQRLRAHDPSYQFEVETNGTILPTEDFDAGIDQYNVSPKLNNSGNAEHQRIRQEVMAYFARSSKAYFKFVCGGADDVDEVNALVTRYQIQPRRVFLMPQGTTTEQIRETSGLLVERCIDAGYNFSDRLHVHLFRNKRGT